MSRSRFAWTVTLILAVLLAGCKMPAPQPTPKESPEALFTAAAQTAEAKGALLALNTPTPLPPTETPVPTVVEPTAVPTGPLVATVEIQPTGEGPVNDKAEFVADITVPDGEAHAPNEPFVKTWRIRNAGETTWTSDYALVFVSGSIMGAESVQPLPKEVPPGEIVDLSVELIAPEEEGIHQGFWKLRNAQEQVFGVGVTATDAIWVTISVSNAVVGTPTLAVGQIVSKARVTVDNPSLTGSCPQKFRFTVEFTLSQASTVTFALEAGSEAGTEIKLPPPTTRNLEAGSHSVVYELIFATSLNGWVRVRFLEPEEVLSRQVNFTLICQ
ncbi:MAG: NBR1-Ig-like domain-containing protein [Chloroflexota bacterium]